MNLFLRENPILTFQIWKIATNVHKIEREESKIKNKNLLMEYVINIRFLSLKMNLEFVSYAEDIH